MNKDPLVFLKHINHYFGVDLRLTFDVIKTKLPSLKVEIKKILDEPQAEKLNK